MKHSLIPLLVVLSLLLGACQKETPAGEDLEWLTNLIARFQSEPVRNPPRSVWRYDYRGQCVYFVPEICCDQYSMLYDAKGSVICRPSGGYGGGGDGRCPDFFQERTNETLIWKDSRSFF